MKIDTSVPELRTGDLLLRPIVTDDREACLDIFSDDRTLKYWSRQPIRTLEEADALIRQELDWSESGNCINWGIALQEPDRLIGKITLFQLNEQNRRAEIGYILDRRQWGKGYMTDAMSCVLDYTFNQLALHRVEADSDPDNAPSLALLEKFGFSREGLFRDRWLMDGKWYDSVMLGLLETDYRK